MIAFRFMGFFALFCSLNLQAKEIPYFSNAKGISLASIEHASSVTFSSGPLSKCTDSQGTEISGHRCVVDNATLSYVRNGKTEQIVFGEVGILMYNRPGETPFIRYHFMGTHTINVRSISYTTPVTLSLEALQAGKKTLKGHLSFDELGMKEGIILLEE